MACLGMWVRAEFHYIGIQFDKSRFFFSFQSFKNTHMQSSVIEKKVKKNLIKSILKVEMVDLWPLEAVEQHPHEASHRFTLPGNTHTHTNIPQAHERKIQVHLKMQRTNLETLFDLLQWR